MIYAEKSYDLRVSNSKALQLALDWVLNIYQITLIKHKYQVMGSDCDLMH